MNDSANFLVIGITSPDVAIQELTNYYPLLESGALDYLHLRKPEANELEMRKFVESIPDSLKNRIKLHSFFHLANEYGLGGVHLNSRFSEFANDSNLKVSKSCHSAEEISVSDCYEYVTLSPIFDSISKQGYSAVRQPSSWSETVRRHRVVALGGVTPDKFLFLKSIGFSGGAMLGDIIAGIRKNGTVEYNKRLLELRKSLSLHDESCL